MSNSGASAALDIVKDGAKLKAKLKELADAEASLLASHEKVKKRNKELNAEFDETCALMAELVEKATAKANSISESANGAMRPVEKAKGEVAMAEKALAKKLEKFDFDQKQFVKQRDQLLDREAAFEERVAVFEGGVANLVASVK